MMYQAMPLQNGPDKGIHPEIPWMKTWEKEAELERAAGEDNLMARLVRIDYMAMLEELEFK